MMNIAAGNIQLVAPVANVIGSLQSAGKLVPRAPKNGCRSTRVTSDLEESLANPPSYVAAASFPSPERPAAPSHTLPCPPLSRYRSLLLRTLVSPHQLHQRRGFKTQRTVDKERQRLPTLAEQMKESLQLGRAAPTTSDPTPSTKLKELSDQSSTPEESQRLKVAFAEGYVHGGENRTKKGIFTLTNILRLASIGLIAYFLFGAMQANNMFRLQFSSNEVIAEEVEVTFDDVRGADEAKQELQDIVAYLRDPDRFSQLGGKLPKGVLLTGPPGTGKTLLARAVAGEANVPFFHASGSEFDEIFVGQGARRVRDLFRTAKARAPCVLFIDEIDSVGGKRSASRHHPYANQTINQLLTEMDGFHSNEGVIVLGATNRRDHLDAALLRPGRFDVEVTVALPDLPGRKEILRLYLSKVKVDGDVDVDNLARGAVGFTGADIENIVNQAALRAAMLQATSVGMKHLDWARDKVMMGAERKTRLPDEETNRTTAYHEGGHTLVAFFTKHAHPVHKVTIMPRNRSLGHTSQIPKKDQFQNTRAQLLARLDVLMGGRAAEDIFLGRDSVTTGASDDLKKATDLAMAMVKQLGMSEKVGLRTIADHEADNGGTVSDSTAELVDAEVKRLLHESYERAKTLLVSRSKELNLLAEALLKYETLDAEDIAAIVKGDAIVKP